MTCGEREAMVRAPPAIHDSTLSPFFHGCLAFHHNLLPDIPSDLLPAVNSSPCPGIAPQSLNSSSQPLHLPGIYVPVWGMNGCGKDCLILIPLRLPQTSCSTLSLKCFSSDSAIALMCRLDPASVPPPAKGRSSPTNTPVPPR